MVDKGIKGDFMDMVNPVKGIFSDGFKGIMPNLIKCGNFMEFSGCLMLSFLAHSTGVGSINYAIIFSVLYVVYGNQMKIRLRCNPALSMADFMRGDNGECCDVFKQVMFQIFGYSAGFALGGLIGLTEHVSSSTGDDFSAALFDNVLSSAVLCWLWMHIHDSSCNSGWKDFMGLAAGLSIWLSAQMAIKGAHMNAAIFAGEDFGKTIGFWRADGWAINDFAIFFAPIISAFLTSLVYAFFRK